MELANQSNFSHQSVNEVEGDVPSGAIGLQRKTSDTSALMYGSCSRSASVGSLSVPMTASSSRCARFCTSGWSVIARKKVVIADTVCTDMSGR